MPTDKSEGFDRPQLWAVFGTFASGVAVLIALIAFVWPDGLDGVGAEQGTASISVTPSPLPTTASPTPGEIPRPSTTPRPPDTVIRIEIVQPPTNSQGSDVGQLFVSLLTATGALLAGVGALAALRRTRPNAGPPSKDQQPTAQDQQPPRQP
jgi:hypothetical protein